MTPDNAAAIKEIDRRKNELLTVLQSLEQKPGMQKVTDTAAKAIKAGVDLVVHKLGRK